MHHWYDGCSWRAPLGKRSSMEEVYFKQKLGQGDWVFASIWWGVTGKQKLPVKLKEEENEQSQKIEWN